MAELVSVITPVYQGQGHVRRAVDSLLRQTHQEWECLLVSDDGTDYLGWLRQQGVSDPRLRQLFSTRTGSGPNLTRNLALRAARGQWIAPLDADDCYDPQRLQRLLALAGETGLAADNARVVDDSSDRVLHLAFSHERQGRLELDDFFHTHVPLLFVFHRQLIQRGWDDLPRGADTLFNLRALEQAGYARYCTEPLHDYRVHRASLCHSADAGERFAEAYALTLQRLQEDGLGFGSPQMRQQVMALIHFKQQLNQLFSQRCAQGYAGTFQNFVDDLPPAELQQLRQ
ncbi:glycosyltransferase family 2 protein [Pokkaliibacter plantistimulans]|uniref:glycosyltransferase family 2 protein n=1 Tax=Pokkaliibacter plantistimulans TaxID=1635171 RepID=UPI000D740CD6|nr:glycosyltransferase family 2 protein [Pokkaliibacter plantistimulans]